ncbi:hypothetical protein AOQ84DRAFT_69345 [Glonium stellatum]|uniref:Uncharacterized protein n=1 Tax=Glonium stellatum TaxID=574774 RepID=A0A8E2EXU5_9PEZI|nr:hypothetical protein AOQ84DRAFT_69345 [Glonium stellatum]
MSSCNLSEPSNPGGPTRPLHSLLSVMATQHALSLPEILSIILAYVHVEQSLFNCMLVNSLWAVEAASIQWANQPPLPRLETISPERQQFYASKVRSCSVDIDPTVGSVLSLVKMRNLAFPRLDAVTLVIPSIAQKYILDENMTHPFLSPTLRKLRIPGYMPYHIREKLLLTIAVRKHFHVNLGILFPASPRDIGRDAGAEASIKRPSIISTIQQRGSPRNIEL